MNLYMHTINGRPAELSSTGYIVYCGHYIRRLATSLAQIRKEQAAVIAKDAAEGTVEKWAYGYVRISEKALAPSAREKS